MAEPDPRVFDRPGGQALKYSQLTQGRWCAAMTTDLVNSIRADAICKTV